MLFRSGRRVDFKNAVIIMTSNVGARSITDKRSLGFSNGESSSVFEPERIKSEVLAELKKMFRPEFLNRVDDTIVFHQLSEDDIEEIARRMLKQLSRRTKAMGISAEFSDAAVKAIAKEGFDAVYGARPLRRAIQSNIEDAVSERILEGRIKPGQTVVCDFADGAFSFDVRQ